jgi:hypothetical protein
VGVGQVSAPDRLVDVYVGALDLCGVFVLQRPDGLVKVGAGVDPSRTMKREAGELALLRWCGRIDRARMVLDVCRGPLRAHGAGRESGWFAIDVDTAAHVVLVAAEELGVRLETHEQVLNSTRHAIRWNAVMSSFSFAGT